MWLHLSITRGQLEVILEVRWLFRFSLFFSQGPRFGYLALLTLMDRRHVFSDLEPYVCVMAECKFSHIPFTEKNTWIQHLKLEHDFPSVSKQMACPLCQERIGSGGTAHLARHLEEASLTILPTNTESDDESDENAEEASKDKRDISYETFIKRQGWVPRSYAMLVGNGSAAEGGSVDPEPPRPNPEFEFQTRWGESSQATLPSAFPPLVPLGGPWVGTGAGKIAGAVADGSRRTGGASEEEDASGPRPRGPLEEFKKRGTDEKPKNGDFVLFEGVRDDLVYFPPLLDNTEGLQGASQELPEKDAAYSGDKLQGVPLQNLTSRGRKNRRDYPPSWGFDKGQMTMKKRVMAVFDGEQPTRGFPSLSFRCPQPGCRATFTRKDNLERHQRRHWDDESKWRCMEPGCATKWSTEEQLDQHHAETHAKPEFHTETKPDDSNARPVESKGRGLFDPGLESMHPFKPPPRTKSLYVEESFGHELPPFLIRPAEGNPTIGSKYGKDYLHVAKGDSGEGEDVRGA